MARVEERSVSAVLADIVGNVQDIVRSEVRLAKAEVKEETAHAAHSVGFIACGIGLGVVRLWSASAGRCIPARAGHRGMARGPDCVPDRGGGGGAIGDFGPAPVEAVTCDAGKNGADCEGECVVDEQPEQIEDHIQVRSP